jgi:hypothetical protein
VYTKAVAVKTLVVEPRHPAISSVGSPFPLMGAGEARPS